LSKKKAQVSFKGDISMDSIKLNVADELDISVTELTNEEFKDIRDEINEDITMRVQNSVASIMDGAEGDILQKKINRILVKNFTNAVHRHFALYNKNEYAGYISFSGYDTDTPEISLEITEKYRYKGIAYKALLALKEKVFSENSDIKYLIYRARYDNVPSIKLVEKLGGQLIITGDFIEEIIKEYHIYR
jgi:hypothetical protein